MKKEILWLTAWLAVTAGQVWKLIVVSEPTLSNYRVMVVVFIAICLTYTCVHANRIYKLSKKRR